MKIDPPPHSRFDSTQHLDRYHDADCKAFLKEVDRKHLYWSELKYRPDFPFDSAEEAWSMVKFHRAISATKLTLGKHRFQYSISNAIQKDLHDFNLKLMVGLHKDAIKPSDTEEFFRTSLLDEAIASSQIEGAATTTHLAREMIKTGRNAQNESEQMIINNYLAISEITSRSDEPLSIQLILDIHELMTRDTEASRYAGQFRDHAIHVKDHVTGDIAYTGPEHTEVMGLMTEMIAFVNSEEEFLYPIV